MADASLETDRRFMAATIRFAERHAGLTGTNPSVGTLIVRDGIVVGRGVTALGGRPHAEPVALAEAGERAVGATAYVTLEPCAHHGRTPPCAEALIAARVARVVFAASDPDSRVDGRGAAMLRDAGIAVRPGVMAAEARQSLAGYLARTARKRPEVIVKIAVSADGRIGRSGGGQVRLTGPIANRQTHLLRARADAIMVGGSTVAEDDPMLDVRLPGLAARSPMRIVLDAKLSTDVSSKLVATARTVPTVIATTDVSNPKAAKLKAEGCEIIACEAEPETGRIALPELLEDLAARGCSSLLVEAGAKLAASFLEQELADRVILIHTPTVIGTDGIASPLDPVVPPPGFHLVADRWFGPDRWREFERLPFSTNPGGS